MTASRTAQSRHGARERLLAAALDLFGGADGPVAVTLDDVRREAQVSVGALYHHFGDKAQLLDALYAELMADFQAGFVERVRAEPTAEAGVRAGVRFYLRWVERHRAAAAILLGHRRDTPALRARNRAFFAEVMDWWQTHVHYGALRRLPPDLIAALWLGPAHEVTRHWLTGAGRRPSGAADHLGDAAWQTLAAPTEQESA